MTRTKLAFSLLTLCFALSACSMADKAKSVVGMDREDFAGPGLKDGELAVPENYREWPVFLSDINKTESNEIRDIYISELGYNTKEGQDFPAGTISVMEIWSPKLNSRGEVAITNTGKMLKDELKLIYVMGKSKGAGEMIPQNIRNGDWVYAGYTADGVTPGGAAPSACRGCHIPAADKDYVHRYDEFFAKRDVM